MQPVYNPSWAIPETPWSPIIVPRLPHPHQLPDHTGIAQTALALVVAARIVTATELYRHLPETQPPPENHRETETFQMSPNIITLSPSFANYAKELAIQL